MAVTLIVGIRDLFPEFLADTLILLGTLQTAGAVTAGALQAFLDGSNHFFIFIQPDSHM
jgi:hypothetical protein